MGCYFLLEGIFLAQGLNSCLLFFGQILYNLAIWEAPLKLHDNKISSVIDITLWMIPINHWHL